jgi:ATP-dependent RNA helicase DDX54/DBP10
VKKIRDESGAWIPATYKSKRYAQWKERSKVEENFTADDEDDGDNDHEAQKSSHLHGMFEMYFIDYI